MNSQHISPKFRRSLNLSLLDAFFFSVMVGAGETYFPAYALSAGMSEVMAGFFSTLPLIVGALVQLVTPLFVHRVGSIKKWVVGSTVVQALAFFPLIFYASFGTPSFVLLFAISAIYWGAGFAAGPSWNFWMGHLVPESIANQFFSKRLRFGQLGILVGLLGGGLLLHYDLKFAPFASVFSVLFFVAFLCRWASSIVLTFQHYDLDWKYSERGLHLPKIIGSFVRHREFRGFFGFLFLFYIVIFISSPFVTPYFLGKLKLNYGNYMLALAALFIAKILALPLASRLSEKFGIKRVFYLGIIGISPLPALWPLSQSMWFIISLQAVSGAFWAMFEVSLSVIFFNQVQSEEKIPILTLYNFFNALALILGSLIGGQVLSLMSESFDGYELIFIGGAILRTLVALAFFYKTRSKVKFISASIYETLGTGSVSGPLSNRTRTM